MGKKVYHYSLLYEGKKGLSMVKIKFLLLVPILLMACKSSSKFSGFSYDPPGVTNTVGKTTEPQKQRVIGAGSPKVWISNEFESARASDFYQINNNTFEVLINPENAPINNSPWFAFKIWSDSAHAINLRLKYKNGKHRYLPKISGQKGTIQFSHIIRDAKYDTSDGSSTFALHVSENPQTVSAHFLDNIRFPDLVNQSLKPQKPFIRIDTVGFSHESRPVFEFTANETDVATPGVLILLSRQHPPEVSGYRTYQTFWNELISDSELATEFRRHFIIKAYPIINPDGVANGHWRHNFKGIDLNRDWENFNQPETQAVRDALLPLKDDESAKVFYGIDFHSTNENILYPINEEVVTNPDNLTQRWSVLIQENNPELFFRNEEFDTSSPISKNWIYHTFGSDAVTFEVDDELDESQIRTLGINAAQSLMNLLLEEWKQQQSN